MRRPWLPRPIKTLISDDFIEEAASDEILKWELDQGTAPAAMRDFLGEGSVAAKISMPLTRGVVYISVLLLTSLALLNYLGVINIDASRFLERPYEFVDGVFTLVLGGLNDLLVLLGELVRELNLGT